MTQARPSRHFGTRPSELNWTELNWTDLFSEKNTGYTGQEEMPLTYTLQKQKVQSKLEHE